MRIAIVSLALFALATCGAGTLRRVQESHGREFGCAWRNVEAEQEGATRWVSRGCGFRADWDCADGACVLRDARAHGVSAP